MATSKIPAQLCFRKCPKITRGGVVVACFLQRKEGQVAPLVHGHVQEDEEDEDDCEADDEVGEQHAHQNHLGKDQNF